MIMVWGRIRGIRQKNKMRLRLCNKVSDLCSCPGQGSIILRAMRLSRAGEDQCQKRGQRREGGPTGQVVDSGQAERPENNKNNNDDKPIQPVDDKNNSKPKKKRVLKKLQDGAADSDIDIVRSVRLMGQGEDLGHARAWHGQGKRGRSCNVFVRMDKRRIVGS